jgi:hypothetical protein
MTRTRTNTLAATNCGITVTVTENAPTATINLNGYERTLLDRILYRISEAKKSEIIVRYLDLGATGVGDVIALMYRLQEALETLGIKTALYNIGQHDGRFSWFDVELRKEV